MKDGEHISNNFKGKWTLMELDILEKLFSLLITKYEYPADKIKKSQILSISDPNSKTESKIYADAIVYDQNDKIKIIIKIKSPIQYLYSENVIDQLIFMMLNSDADYGMLYNGREKYCFKKILGTQIIEVPDIPAFGERIFSSKEFDPKIKYEDYFFRTCELLRNHIHDYSVSILCILFAKFIDEKEFENTKLKNLNQNQVKTILQNLIQIGTEKYNIYFDEHEILNQIPNDVLYSIIEETNQFSILLTNPESIIQSIYRIMKKESSFKYDTISIIPESVSLLMYKYLISCANSENIQNRKLLLTHIGNGKIVFDVLRHISDEFELIGKDLREFSSKNLAISDNNRRHLGILKFFLILKGFHDIKILQEEPLFHENSFLYNGIMSTPPLGKIAPEEISIHNDFGIDYVNQYIIKMSERVLSSGYFTLIVSAKFLFDKKSKAVRNFLLEKNILRGIIKLPRGTLEHTTIPPFIIFLQKNPTDEKNLRNYPVFMSDLDSPDYNIRNKISPKILYKVWDKFIELQSINKILDEDDKGFAINIDELVNFDKWQPDLHKPSRRKIFHKGKPLTDFAEIISSSSQSENDTDIIEIPQIRVSDIINEEIAPHIEKTVNVSKPFLKSYKTVKEGDIVLSIKGTIGKFAKITSNAVGSTVNPNLVILRPKINTSDILYFLGTEFVQEQLRNLATGNSIRYLRMSDLENVIIPDFLLNDKLKEKYEKLKNEISELRQKLESKQRELQEFRSEKHDK